MSNTDDFLDVWQTAISRYENQTQRKLGKDDAFLHFASLEDLESHIKHRETKFTAFRDEHGRAFAKMKKCFQPLVPILDLVKIGVELTPYAPAATTFGAAAHLLQACESVSACYDAVEELFEQMGNITMRLREYEHGGMEVSLRVKMAQILAYILEIMGITEKVVRRKRFKQWARSVFMNDDEIKPSMQRLQVFAEEELGLVVALTFARVGELQNTTSDLHKGVTEVLANQRSERLRAFSEADERLIAERLQTDTTSEIARKYQQNVELLTKGTGLWIREDPMFQAWQEERAPILWVLGRPGVGKTMLATRTIELLKDQFPQHPDIPSLTSVSYLYFRDGDPKLQDLAQMWKAAAAQMITANDRFKKHVLAAMKDPGIFDSPRRTWETLFLDFFEADSAAKDNTSHAFIIVDGLDEAKEGERVKFLACLSQLTRRVSGQRRCRIQVAIFARPDVRADSGFDKIGSYHSGRIIVTPDRNFKDIGAFVKQRLGEVRVLKELRKNKLKKPYESLAKRIHSTVLRRSEGMFLWARLVFDQMQELSSPEAVEMSLDQAPTGLDDMLHHVFKRFDSVEQMQQSYLRDLLTWVLWSYRPLRVSEIYVLLRLTAGQRCVSLKTDLQTRYSSIFDMSGPLVEDEGEIASAAATLEGQQSNNEFDFLDDDDTNNSDSEESVQAGENSIESEPSFNEAKRTTEDTMQDDTVLQDWRSNVVTFAHARVRDFLTVEFNPVKRRWSDCAILAHDMNDSKLRIVKACIDILCTDIATSNGLEELVSYAQGNWARHLLEVEFGEADRGLSISLARTLAAFFNDGVALLKSSYGYLDHFVATWFQTNEYSRVARKLISQNIAHLDDPYREWAGRVSLSTPALFECLTKECSRRWLTKTGYEDAAYLSKSQTESWLLYAFNSLGEDGCDEDEPPVFYYGTSIPLADIESAAALHMHVKNEHWYTGVAWIMMEANQEEHTRKAIEYFTEATKMSTRAWVAFEGLAICHGDNLSQYEEGVRLMYRAIHLLTQIDTVPGIEFHLRTKMGSWLRQLGNGPESLQVCKAAYEGSSNFAYPTGLASDHLIILSIRNYIEAMFDAREFDDILTLICDLDMRTTGDMDRSLWIVFLRAQFVVEYDVMIFHKLREIGRALDRDRTVYLVKSSTERAVPLTPDAFSYTGNLWLAMQCITWLYEVSDVPDDAATLLEKVIEIIDGSDEITQQNSWLQRDIAAAFLGFHHFRTAVCAAAAGQDPSPAVKQLDILAHHQQGGTRYVRTSYPALAMAQWLHEYTSADDETWMAYIKPSVQRALHFLSDNDPWNDQQACAQLGQALLCANDMGNACIALGITMTPFEELTRKQNSASEVQLGYARPQGDLATEREASKDDNRDLQKTGDKGVTDEEYDEQPGQPVIEDGVDADPDEPENLKYAGFELIFSCDNCKLSRDRLQNPYKELHFCRMCNDVCFCEDCIEQLRKGELDFATDSTCSSDHKHVMVFPVTQEARALTDALLQKRFEVQEQWLHQLWKTWGDRDSSMVKDTMGS
ncbi:hypothetical protein B0A48_14468 [Cryoendolithus antarcticus]|uniref:Uncharacterized protein n=1 Tax=Cryoendolithus antarcticus TaxID=1507870 RepID=A0A1V8SKP5_9PEZI|nr:hypothetical protein B0A48_14468 [Cryoendolithus antarcticus]